MPAPEGEDAELSQLLREQEAFFRDKARPAAKLVVHPQRDGEGGANEDKLPQQGHDEQEAAEQEVKARPPAVLGGIVERSEGSKAVCQPIKITAGPKLGFPKPDLRKKETGTRRPRPAEKEKSVTFSSAPAPPLPPLPPPSARSREIDGVNLDEIHSENLRRLAGMDVEEVAAAQQEILSMLSPETIDLLRGSMPPPPPLQAAAKQRVEGRRGGGREEARRAELLKRRIDSEEALARAAKELLTEEEREAVDWFTAPRNGGQEEVVALRLDLEGRVIEAEEAESIPAHSGLYHNPEQCAGYTMQQLCDIGHSSDQSQRATAFRTWSLLLRRPETLERVEKAGASLPSELPLVILAGLDDRHLAARVNAVSALEALVVGGEDDGRERDESFDASQGDVAWPPACGPIRLVHYPAKPKGEEEEKDEEEDDDEEEQEEEEEGKAAGGTRRKEKDPLSNKPFRDTDSAVRAVLQDPAVGLIRLGLLPRLQRQIDQPSALQVLAWLAGRSCEVAERVASQPGLMATVEAAALQGGKGELRLLRVLAQASRRVCLAMGGRGTLRASKGVLSLSHVSVPAKVEALRLWRVALGYGADLESLLDVLQLLATPQEDEEGGAQPEHSRLCEGVWLSWPPVLMSALYRALEAACWVVGERRRGGGGRGRILGEVHLDADAVGECGRRLSGVMAALLGSMRERPPPVEGGGGLVLLLSSQAHFLATCVETGLAPMVEVEQTVRQAVEPCLDAILASTAAVKRVLLLSVDAAVPASDVAAADLLLGLVRLWSTDLLQPQGRSLPMPAQALAMAALRRVGMALDLMEEWEQAAASPASSSSLIQGLAATRSVRRQHARRLLVQLEHCALTTLSACGEDEEERLAAQARRAVPLCGPGSEHTCLQLMMLGGLVHKPTLAGMYQQVIVGGRASHPRLLLSRSEPSRLTTFLLHPSLTDPAPLLPLPHHYLLSPLISQAGDDHALTRRLLHDCLTLLCATPSYTNHLPPGVLLYHLLSLCLFPPEAISDTDITTSFFHLAQPALSRLQPPSTLPTQLAQAALTLQPLGGMLPSNSSTSTSPHRDSLQSFVDDLLEACQEGAHGLGPHAWALRLLLQPAFGSDLRLHVWRDLAKTSLLHVLDDDGGGGGGGGDDMRRLLEPTDRDADVLDCYSQALGQRYYPPLTLDRGGLALLYTTHHLVHDLAATVACAGALRESQRRRVQRLVEEATPEALDLLLIQAVMAAEVAVVGGGGGGGGSGERGTFAQMREKLEGVMRRVRGGEAWPTVVMPGQERLAAMVVEAVGPIALPLLEEKCPWFVRTLCVSQ